MVTGMSPPSQLQVHTFTLGDPHPAPRLASVLVLFGLDPAPYHTHTLTSPSTLTLTLTLTLVLHRICLCTLSLTPTLALILILSHVLAATSLPLSLPCLLSLIPPPRLLIRGSLRHCAWSAR